LLGSISFGAGQRAKQYAKAHGVIYPIDKFGALLFNKTNTPRLVAMRTWYHEEAKRVNDTRLEIAEMSMASARPSATRATSSDTWGAEMSVEFCDTE
jgi:hypothetical protein